MVRRLRTVRVRVALAATAVTALAVGLAAAGLVTAVRGTLRERIRERAETSVAEVAAVLEGGAPPGEVMLAPPAGAMFVQVIGPDGHVVAGPPAPPSSEKIVVPVPVEGGLVTVDRPFGDAPVDVTFRSVGAPDGDYTVVAMSPLDEVERSVDALVGVLRFALPGLVLAVGGVAWLVAGRALRPVEAIRAEVEAVRGSTIHRRVPEPGTGDEVDRLARTMNAMLDRLESSSRRQRQFVADASHELRSPVAAMRTELEVALLRPERADWTAVAAGVLEEETRLEALVDDLLLLAALDDGPAPGHGTTASPPGAVDLADVVATESRRARRVPVTVTAERAVVAGDRRELARAVGNLLDNAARHATSTVAVTVAASGGRAVVHVDDDGPGIPPADRERVFDRFTRLEPARTRAGGGAGLGLALVRRIAERHGGRAAAGESPAGGARLTVEVPLGT